MTQRWLAIHPLAVALVLAAGIAPSLGDAAVACVVAKPSRVPLTPGFNAGNDRIAVWLPPHATLLGVPDHGPDSALNHTDGWLRVKVAWWRKHGTLRLRGRRLDRQARPVVAEVGPLPSYGPPAGEFFPSALYFASAGCWKITATAGSARLDVVVRVVKA